VLGENFFFPYSPAPIADTNAACTTGVDAGACGAWGEHCQTSGTCCSGLQCIENNDSFFLGYCVP
jgi:hypothetical protein